MGISGEEEIEMTSPSATPSMDEMRAGFVAWQDRVGDWREGGWEAFQAAVAWATARERERCAKVCEKRAELRFEAHGYTEPDTNASYTAISGSSSPRSTGYSLHSMRSNHTTTPYTTLGAGVCGQSIFAINCNHSSMTT